MGSSKHAIMIGMPQVLIPERTAGQGCRYRLISSCTVWGDGTKEGRANEALFPPFHTDAINIHHLAAEPARYTKERDANNRQENGSAHVWADIAGVRHAQ